MPSGPRASSQASATARISTTRLGLCAVEAGVAPTLLPLLEDATTCCSFSERSCESTARQPTKPAAIRTRAAAAAHGGRCFGFEAGVRMAGFAPSSSRVSAHSS